MIVQY